MRKTLLTLIALCLAAMSSILPAADNNRGKTLQQENCMRCHDDGMYTRKDRRITDVNSLHNQVQRCETTLGLKWFNEDVAAVTSYLNATYYKFQ